MYQGSCVFVAKNVIPSMFKMELRSQGIKRLNERGRMGKIMTNKEKNLLRQLALAGWSFNDIRQEVSCSDATIRVYIKLFRGKGKK
jgi:DNA-binding NarL/FixJ family response regulator